MVAAWSGGMVRVLAVLAALALGACDSVEERVSKHYQRGLELAEDGQFAKATVEFRNALKLNENHPGARYQIGLAYERDGEVRAAFGNFSLAAELDPANIDVRIRLARFLVLAGQLDEAERNAREALGLDPGRADAHAALAAVLLRKGDAPGALASAQAALAVEPGHAAAGLVIASERYAAGDVAAALARLDALLAAAPVDLGANLLKIRILEAEGRGPELVAQLERMIALYPAERGWRRALVQQLARAGKDEAVESALRDMVQTDPADEQAANELVNWVGSRKGPDAARAEIGAMEAAATDPARRAALRLARVRLEQGAGEPAAARALLGEMVAGEPHADSRNRARLLLAAMDREAGDTAAARALVETVLKEDARNVEALALRATMKLAADDAPGAIVDLREAVSADPENVRLMLLMAQAYERNGSPDLAADRLAAATRLSDYEPGTALLYARFLQGRAQGEAAGTVLEETARRHGENPRVLAALAEHRVQRQDWKGAAEAAAALSRVQGDDSASRQVEAMALLAGGDRAKGIGVLSELAEAPGAPMAVVVRLARAHVEAGEPAQAVALVDGLIAREPASTGLRLLRAELHLVEGKPDAAEAALRTLIAETPGSDVGHVALARLELARGQPAAAEAVLDTAVAEAPPATGARLLRAQLLEARGAIDAAIADYDVLADAVPNSLVVANNLAALLAQYRADDVAAVARAARIAQRLRGSTIPEFQDTYGWTLHLSGDSEGALRSLAPAAAARPQNPWIRFHAGMAFAALGRGAEARAHLEAALASAPDFPRAEAARAALGALPAVQ